MRPRVRGIARLQRPAPDDLSGLRQKESRPSVPHPAAVPRPPKPDAPATRSWARYRSNQESEEMNYHNWIINAKPAGLNQFCSRQFLARRMVGFGDNLYLLIPVTGGIGQMPMTKRLTPVALGTGKPNEFYVQGFFRDATLIAERLAVVEKHAAMLKDDPFTTPRDKARLFCLTRILKEARADMTPYKAEPKSLVGHYAFIEFRIAADMQDSGDYLILRETDEYWYGVDTTSNLTQTVMIQLSKKYGKLISSQLDVVKVKDLAEELFDYGDKVEDEEIAFRATELGLEALQLYNKLRDNQTSMQRFNDVKKCTCC
jgi:hypothetical protein